MCGSRLSVEMVLLMVELVVVVVVVVLLLPAGGVTRLRPNCESGIRNPSSLDMLIETG